jgi:hypothetical protein
LHTKGMAMVVVILPFFLKVKTYINMRMVRISGGNVACLCFLANKRKILYWKWGWEVKDLFLFPSHRFH